MLTLHAPSGGWSLPSLSPFCVKLETWLRMAGLDYTRVSANPNEAPKGKVPYVTLPDGTKMGDSQLIIDHLTAAHGLQVGAPLSPEQAAIGHAVRRMLEEGTYWCVVHDRWITAAGWAAYRPKFGALLPAAIRWAALPMIRGTVRRQLRAQGTGRHTPDEIARLACTDIDAVAGVMGHRDYLLGPQPSAVDAIVYAALASILDFPVDTAARDHLQAQPTLVAYTARMRARYWAD